MRQKKVNLMNLTRAQMREFFAELGEKPFRADQLVKWIYHFGEDNFDNMTNLNKKLREKLKSVAEIKAPEVAVEQRSADGTIKWAMQVGDQQVETVYIPEADRATLVFLRRLVARWPVLFVLPPNKDLTAI